MELDIKWNIVKESCLREFFKFYSKHRVRNHIKEINLNGMMVKDPQEIKKTMMEFYMDLYK